MIKQIIQYETLEGRCPFREWLLSFKDLKIRSRIRARIDRLLLGSFGDTKVVGEGVFELRYHFGPGYRVYFGIYQNQFVILLSGGDKNTQEKDIYRAQQYFQDYLRRNQ